MADSNKVAAKSQMKDARAKILDIQKLKEE